MEGTAETMSGFVSVPPTATPHSYRSWLANVFLKSNALQTSSVLIFGNGPGPANCYLLFCVMSLSLALGTHLG